MDLLSVIPSVLERFQIRATFRDARPCGRGHINDTFEVRCLRDGEPVRFAVQRINQHVFHRPAEVMENIERVLDHLAVRVADEPEASHRALSLIPTHEGRMLLHDGGDSYWRVYDFVEGARTHDRVEGPRQAYEVARAFGWFQAQLADLPAPPLHQTIPGFHDTPARFAALQRAIETDTVNRAAGVRAEIAFALGQEAWIRALIDAGLPERITHNDTKLNNVMLDDASGEAVCVIDLDTVMPGLVAYDFGDLVRTAANAAAEDERDLANVHMQWPVFEALVRGYLSTAGGFLTKGERALLAFAGKLMTFEVGIRFLTDHLQGDTYFKIHRPEHNLDRARAQFALVRSIAEQEERMQRFVDEA